MTHQKNRPSADKMGDVLGLSQTILGLFGLIEPYKTCQTLHFICHLIGIFLKINGWLSFALNTAVIMAALLEPEPDRHTSAIIQTLCFMPYSAINLRGTLAVTVFFCPHKKWREIWRLISETVRQNGLLESGGKQLWKFHLTSLSLTVVTLSLIVMWGCVSAATYLETAKETLSSPNTLHPLAGSFKANHGENHAELLWNFEYNCGSKRSPIITEIVAWSDLRRIQQWPVHNCGQIFAYWYFIQGKPLDGWKSGTEIAKGHFRREEPLRWTVQTHPTN